MPTGSLKISVLREVALLLGLVLAGLVLVPIAIYWVGPQLLGEFGGHGFADFFGSLGARIRSGEAAAWFLVLSPYLAVQVLRLTRLGWRSTQQSNP
jgi:hypothetical protein